MLKFTPKKTGVIFKQFDYVENMNSYRFISEISEKDEFRAFQNVE